MHKRVFVYNKECKHSVQFKEVDGDLQAIGAVYMRKEFLEALGWKKGNKLSIIINLEEK